MCFIFMYIAYQKNRYFGTIKRKKKRKIKERVTKKKRQGEEIQMKIDENIMSDIPTVKVMYLLRNRVSRIRSTR